MLQSWADSKKKSNLVLSTFLPGKELPWLGGFKRLGPAAEMLTGNPYVTNEDDDSTSTPFPVTPSHKRSYTSQASVVWIKASGLQVCVLIRNMQWYMSEPVMFVAISSIPKSPILKCCVS